jgi:hypothetical protein
MTGAGAPASCQADPTSPADPANPTLPDDPPRGFAALVLAGIGFAAWLPLDLWFFLAQHGARTEQFPPFHLIAALRRLGTYAAANLFGGLPLYAGAAARPVVSAGLATMLLLLAGLVVARWRTIGHSHTRPFLAAAALAPPCGLLLLGLTFDSTPIELRYLAFATPFVALLLAGTLASLPRRSGHWLAALVLGVQALALAGLLTRPETMQPARATARSAARLAGDALVLLPRGNDGVGIVGAFAIEAPPDLMLLVVAPNETPAAIRRRIAGRSRIVLALLGQDAASRATLPLMRAAVSGPCWRPAGNGFNVAAFQRICDPE